jgi:hypothetical protein
MILRFALLALIGRRRRLLALLGLAFVAARYLWRRRRRKRAEEVSAGSRPIEGVGTQVVG